MNDTPLYLGYSRPDYIFMRTCVDLFLRGEPFNSATEAEYNCRLMDVSEDFKFPVPQWTNTASSSPATLPAEEAEEGGLLSFVRAYLNAEPYMQILC